MSRLTYCIVDGKVCKSFNDMFCCKECETYYQYVLSRGSSTSSVSGSDLFSDATEDAADDLEFEEECFSKPAVADETSQEQVYYHSNEEMSDLDEDSELSSEEEDDEDYFNIYTTSKRSNRDSIFSIYKNSRKSHESHSSASSFENMSPLSHKDNHYKCIKFDSLFVAGPKQQQQQQLNCIETLVKNEQDSTNYKKLTTIPQNSYQIWIKNQN